MNFRCSEKILSSFGLMLNLPTVSVSLLLYPEAKPWTSQGPSAVAD